MALIYPQELRANLRRHALKHGLRTKVMARYANERLLAQLDGQPLPVLHNRHGHPIEGGFTRN